MPEFNIDNYMASRFADLTAKEATPTKLDTLRQASQDKITQLEQMGDGTHPLQLEQAASDKQESIASQMGLHPQSFAGGTINAAASVVAGASKNIVGPIAGLPFEAAAMQNAAGLSEAEIAAIVRHEQGIASEADRALINTPRSVAPVGNTPTERMRNALSMEAPSAQGRTPLELFNYSRTAGGIGRNINETADIGSIVHQGARNRMQAGIGDTYDQALPQLKQGWEAFKQGDTLTGMADMAPALGSLVAEYGAAAGKNKQASLEYILENVPQLAIGLLGKGGKTAMTLANAGAATDLYEKGIEKYRNDHRGAYPSEERRKEMAAYAVSHMAAEQASDMIGLGAIGAATKAMNGGIIKGITNTGIAAAEGLLSEAPTEAFQTFAEGKITGKEATGKEIYTGSVIGGIAGGGTTGGLTALAEAPGAVLSAASAAIDNASQRMAAIGDVTSPTAALEAAQNTAKETGDVTALTDPDNVAYAPDRAIQALMSHAKQSADPEAGETNLMQAYEVASQFNQAYLAKTAAYDALTDKATPEAKNLARELNTTKKQVLRADKLLAQFEADFFASLNVEDELAKLDTTAASAAGLESIVGKDLAEEWETTSAADRKQLPVSAYITDPAKRQALGVEGMTVDAAYNKLTQANTGSPTKAASNLINLSMAVPERMNQKIVDTLLNNAATTEEQRDYLRKFSATRAAENQLRTQGAVSTEIADGSPKNKGIKQYRADVTTALASGSAAKAESQMTLLKQFMDSHTQKAALSAEAFETFKATGQLSQVQRNDTTKEWFVVTDETKFLKGQKRVDNGAVTIDHQSARLVPGIQKEADAIADAHAELRSAIALRFPQGGSNVPNPSPAQAVPVAAQPVPTASPVPQAASTGTASPTVPTKPGVNTGGGWALDNARETVALFRKSNPSILDKVEQLHADDKTAAEIAAELKLDVDTVRDLRNGLGLPGQGKASGGISGMGTPADAQERAAFEAWRDARKAAATTVNSDQTAASGSSTGVNSQSTTSGVEGQTQSNAESTSSTPITAPEVPSSTENSTGSNQQETTPPSVTATDPQGPDAVTGGKETQGLSIFQDASKTTELPDGKLGNGGYRAINRAKAFLQQKHAKAGTELSKVKPLADINNFLSRIGSDITFAQLFTEPLTDKQQTALANFEELAGVWTPVIESYFGKDGKGTVKAGKKYSDTFKHEDVLQDLYDADGNLDANVVTAIIYAMYSWLGDTANGDLFKDGDAIAEMHGLPEGSHVTGTGKFKLGPVAAMEDTILNDLGPRILQALALTAKPGAPVDYLPKLATALGTLALRAMEDQQLVQTTTHTGAELSQWIEGFQLDDEKSISYVSLVRGDKEAKWALPEVTQSIKDTNSGTGQIVDKLFDAEKTPSEASWKPIPFKQDTAKRTNQSISQEQVETLEQAQKVPLRIIPQMWDLLTVLGDAVILKAAGFKGAEEGSVHSANRDSYDAQDANLTQQLDRVKTRVGDAIAESKEGMHQPFFLNHEVWRNFRTGIATRDLNPQSSKIVRFMFYRPEWKATLKTDNVDQFLIAVGQAIGVKVDQQANSDTMGLIDKKLAKHDLDALALRLNTAIGSKTAMSQEDKDAVANFTSGEEGMQTLQALVAYGNYLSAKADAEKTGKPVEFTVHMLVGVDGKTNGPILSHLALGAAENIVELFKHLKRGGMFNLKEGFKNFNVWYQQRNDKGEKNLDLYEDLARHILSKVDRNSEGYKALETFTKSLLDDQGQVSSAGRKIVKTPLTAFAFGSAVARSREAMQEAFVQSIHDKIEAVATGEDTTISRDALVLALNTLLGDMALEDDITIEQLMKLNFFDKKNKPWLDALNASFHAAMGIKVEEAMNTYFAVFSARRDAVNNSIKGAFRIYSALMKDIEATEMNRLMDEGEIDFFMEKEKDANGKNTGKEIRVPLHGLTKTQQNVLLDKMEAMLPQAHTAYSAKEGNLKAGLYMGKRSTGRSDKPYGFVKTQLGKPFKNGAGDMVTFIRAAIMEQREKDPGVAGLPYMMHSTDSAIMHRALAQYIQAMNVHDEIGNGVDKISDTAKAINGSTWTTMLEYSPPTEAFNLLARSVTNALTLHAKGDMSQEALMEIQQVLLKMIPYEERKPFYKNPQHIATEVLKQMWQMQHAANLIRLGSMAEMTAIDQYTWEGGQYDVTDTDRARASELLAEEQAQKNLPDDLAAAAVELGKLFKTGIQPKKTAEDSKPAITEKTLGTTPATAPWATAQGAEQVGTKEAKKVAAKVATGTPVVEAINAMPETDKAAMVQATTKAASEVDNARMTPWGVLGESRHDHDQPLVEFFQKNPTTTVRALIQQLNKTVEKGSFQHELLKQLARSNNLNAKVHYISKDTDPKIAPFGIPKNPAGVPMSRAWYASANGDIYVTGTDFKHSAVKEEVMLHEMVHAALTQVINNPTAETLPYIKELESLMAQAKSVADSTFDTIFQEEVGIHEFVTYGMTNRAFQTEVLMKTTLVSKTRGGKLRNAMQGFIHAITGLFFRDKQVSDAQNNGMAALIANVSALMEQAAQDKLKPPLKSDGNYSMAAVQSVLEYSTQDVFEALDNGRLSADDTARLSGLLTTMVQKLHGKFGSLRQAIMNTGYGAPEDAYLAARAAGELPFASKVLAGPFAVSDQVAFVLEQVEVTVKTALDSPDAAAKSAYGELTKLFLEAKEMLRGKISDDQHAFLFTAIKDTGDLSDYLARFAAMGLTHPDVHALLQRSTATGTVATGGSIGDKVQRWFEKALELLTNKLTGTYAGQRADLKLQRLVQQLVDIETRNKMPLAKNAFLDSMMEAGENLGEKVTNTARDTVNTVANSRFVKGSQNQFIRTAGTLGKLYANDRVDAFLDGIKQVRNREFAGTEGLLASLVTEARGHLVVFQKLIRAAKMKEGERKDIIEQGAAAVLAGYENGDKLTEAEKAGLSQIFMRSGAHHLLDAYDLKQIEQLLTDETLMNREIVKLEKRLSAYGSLREAVVEQAQVLGYYKATGYVKSEILHANAHNISRLIGTNAQKHIDEIMAYKQEATIAQLVSLYAMAYAKPEHRSQATKVLARENARETENGVEFTLKLHKAMEQEAFEKLFKGNPTLMLHGYTPEVYNPNTRMAVANDEDGKELEAQGFKKGARIKAAKGDDSGDKNIYTQEDGGLNRRVTGGMSLTDLGNRGSELMIDNPNQFTKQKVVEWASRTKGGNWKTLGNRKDNHPAPIFNENGQIAKWVYLMAEDTKDTVLERDNRFEHLLGKLAGSTYDKVETPVQNKKVIEVLREDYNQAYADNPEAFIEIGAATADNELREIWNLLPQQTKADVRKIWGRDAMLVRKDSVNIIFGYRKLSAGDMFTKENRGYLEDAFVRLSQEIWGDKAEHKVRQFERRWLAVVQEIKDIVVIKTGTVLIGNIKSNTMLLAAAGVPLKQGINSQLVALRGATAYRKDSERLAQLKLVVQADYTQGKMKEIEDEIIRLEDSLARNPVKALIDEGLMPSIVEDVSGGEDIYAHRTQFAKDVNEKMDAYLHPSIKAGLRTVYMAHDTKLYQGLHRTTQLSDFVARYALVQHLTTRKKNPLSMADAIQQASESFINYDIPMHPFLQYLDDMGIMPFMKYFLRIQKVLVRLMRESPARSLGVIGLDNLLGIGDSVFDSSILNKVGNNPLTTGAVRIFDTVDELATVSGAMALIK